MTDDHTHRGDDVHSVELAAREANGGWQPIETAPKDGTHIILSCKFLPNDWRIKIGGWRFDKNNWQLFGGSWTPTHWMPLPAAPTEGE